MIYPLKTVPNYSRSKRCPLNAMPQNNFLSPYLIPALFLFGLLVYIVTDSHYYGEMVMAGGAYKYISATSILAFSMCILSTTAGIYLGCAPSGALKRKFSEFEPDFFTRLLSITRLIVVGCAVMLVVSHYQQGDLLEKVFSGDINNFRESFDENATLTDRLILTLRHLIYVWGSTLFFSTKKMRLRYLVEILLVAVIIGLLTQSRLMVVTLIAVLLVSYARNNHIKTRFLFAFTLAAFGFLGFVTFVRSYAFSGELDSESFTFILVEILRYFITPYGYSLAIIDLSGINLEYGMQQILSFFLISFGKFFGQFDESINTSFIGSISPYYYPSLNQIGSVGSMVYGFGVAFSQVIFLFIGYLLGTFSRRFSKGHPVSVVIYPILFAIALDLIRFPSIFSGALPTCLLFTLAYRLYWIARYNSRVSF